MEIRPDPTPTPEPRGSWRNTTHDWAATVDPEHLARIRRAPATFAPGGPGHLVLEVLAYAADEAASRGGGRCLVTLHPDGSVAVADDGRGTDTRFDTDGRAVQKPIMATEDLRFFDVPGAERLPDGQPRRGMSTVAALSRWLLHTNRRANGAWRRRYAHGVPVTALEVVPADGTTGTLVHFLPDEALGPRWSPTGDEPARWRAHWPDLTVRLDDRRTPGKRPGH
ncbi:ATP-binding protein [Streptomyces sp. NPDC014733]|uniref:ATP-binding protein n=1 Tax=Streptomyces sp. NPDC014733 TaxID=3364885 RepID=UPI0036F9C247